MLIRTAREEDLEACAAIDLSYDTETAWQMSEAILGHGWGASFQKVRLPRRQHIEHPASNYRYLVQRWQERDGFWVVVEDREVVGYLGVQLELVSHQARVCDLGITPEHRRKGYATALLSRCIEWLSRYPIDHLIMECPLKAEPAVGLALKHHFTFCGYQEGYWPGQEVAMFFTLRIHK